MKHKEAQDRRLDPTVVSRANPTLRRKTQHDRARGKIFFKRKIVIILILIFGHYYFLVFTLEMNL